MEIQIKGTINFMGKEIPNVYGGFGDNKKVVLAKNIAEIHEVETKYINKLINHNQKRFKEGVDIIDLKNCGSCEELQLKQLGFTQMQISKANNIYLLSERGYAKLIKIMDSDLAWEIHDQLVDDYFTMREEKEKGYLPQLSPTQQCAMVIFDSNSTDLEKIEALKTFQTISRQEGGAVICDDSLITIPQVREIVMKHYGDILEQNGVLLTDSFIEFNRYMKCAGYLYTYQFDKKNGKGKEKTWSHQPTPLFYEILVAQAMATLRTIDDRGKLEITYTRNIENLITSESFKQGFLKYFGIREEADKLIA